MALVACSPGSPPPRKSLQAEGLDGQTIELLPDGATASVLVFVAHDCPISNRYVPELERLYDQFGPRGIRFFAIYSGPDQESRTVEEHVEAFAIPFAAVLDPTGALVEATGVTVTPEAAVLDGAGRLLYRGRIDDRYVDFGRYRQTATREDLRLALDQILDGEPVTEERTRAIGCYLETGPPTVGNGV